MSLPEAEQRRTYAQKVAEGTLSDLLGMEVLEASRECLRARIRAGSQHLGPTGLVHAGTVVTLADTCAGMGCVANLPEGARGFTTVELKVNFLRAARAGASVVCEARMIHGGRTTQVWDATVTREDDDAVLAHYRCTQLILSER